MHIDKADAVSILVEDSACLLSAKILCWPVVRVEDGGICLQYPVSRPERWREKLDGKEGDKYPSAGGRAKNSNADFGFQSKIRITNNSELLTRFELVASSLPRQ